MNPSFKEQLLAEIEKIRAETGATEAEAYALLRWVAGSEGGVVERPKPEEERPGPRMIMVRYQFNQEEHEEIKSRPARWEHFMFYKIKMTQYHKAYLAGDPEEVFRALEIHDALAPGLPYPQWISTFLVVGAVRFNLVLERTLDEAFGVPRRRVNIKAARRRLRLSSQVYGECVRLTDLGRPIDDGLFEEVGEKFGIGKTLAKKYFYGIRRFETTTR